MIPTANPTPFFRVIDVARRRRSAFCRGEQLFLHLHIPGARRARIAVRGPRGREIPGTVERALTAGGELLVSMSIPQHYRPGHYRIDVVLDSALHVYEKIVVSN